MCSQHRTHKATEDLARRGREGQDLVFKGGGEPVVEHLLVEDRGDAARHGGHDPHPVCRTAPPAAVFVLHVLNEGLGGRVVVNDGHFVTLWVERGQESGGKRAGVFQDSPTERRFLKDRSWRWFSAQYLSAFLLLTVPGRKSPFAANRPLERVFLSPPPPFFKRTSL